MSFTPTAEQLQAVELFSTGQSIAIEAGAGSGKTSTLKLLAEAAGGRRGRYVAFNRSIADHAKRIFPSSVQSGTAHSLAWRAVVSRTPFMDTRLELPKLRPSRLASLLGLKPVTIQIRDPRGVSKTRTLSGAKLGGVVLRSVLRFCQTDDLYPDLDHVVAPEGTVDCLALAAKLLPAVCRAWDMLQRSDCEIPLDHAHYLKMYQLTNPILPVDYVLLDEAQDANPVILAIVTAQAAAGKQVVYVGDSQQSIYAWNGAIDAMANIPAAQRCRLTRSFRFGSEVAEVANGLLARLEAPFTLEGSPGIESALARLSIREADVVLCRMNATAVELVLDALDDGMTAHMVGGAADMLAFARGARDLKDGKPTEHPELSCFDAWSEVKEFVGGDGAGSDLAKFVKLVDRFTPGTILYGLGNLERNAEKADVVISTAHKAKGLEWNRVKLANDFSTRSREKGSEDESVEELRLLYVACTRAKFVLDVSDCPDALEAPYNLF